VIRGFFYCDNLELLISTIFSTEKVYLETAPPIRIVSQLETSSIQLPASLIIDVNAQKMRFIFSFLKPFTAASKNVYQRRNLSTNTVNMASSSDFNAYLPSDTIPTAETKIKLGNTILVSPLSE
jgi:hypothetical protein